MISDELKRRFYYPAKQPEVEAPNSPADPSHTPRANPTRSGRSLGVQDRRNRHLGRCGQGPAHLADEFGLGYIPHTGCPSRGSSHRVVHRDGRALRNARGCTASPFGGRHGKSDELDLAAFLGQVLVVDATGHAEIPEHLVADTPVAERLLFRTDNSVRGLMRSSTFAEDFVWDFLAAANALARRAELLLVGNDYLSVQPWSADDEVHRVLLSQRIVLLEGLDLAHVQPGWYELIALPILLRGAEAAPVRAVLRRTTPDGK